MRLVPRTIALLGAAAVLLIAATYGVADAFLSGSKQPGRPKHATDAKVPVKPSRGAGHPSATPSPSSPVTGAACLIGHWIGTSEDLTGTINNISVIYTGPGPAETYNADGTSTATYNGSKYSTTVNGVRWTEVERGSASYHYEIQNGMMLYSDIKDHGTWTLYENGAYNNSGPFTIVATPERFTCSGNTLREYPSNGSVVSRRAPVPHKGLASGS